MALVSTSAFHGEALPYLQKAIELGESSALFSIGLVLVRRGDRAAGLAALQAYAGQHPDDAQVRRLIDAVQKGTLSFPER